MGRFTLLTFNCFGVPAFSTSARLRTLAQVLDQECPDVACLQEVQFNRYLKRLRGWVRELSHTAHEPFLHAPKGGLLTLSRHPILSSRFTLYRHRGWWHTPSLADWLLHKGALVTRLLAGDLPVEVVNTHLIANYDGDWGRENRYARVEHLELRQLVGIVNALPADSLVLVAGDFNVPRGAWPYAEFLAATGLVDSLAGTTEPTYRLPRALPTRYARAIDHIFYRSPAGLAVRVESRLRFQEPMPLVNGRHAHLSDHYGVEIRLAW